MAFVEPVKGRTKVKGRKKHLTIYNTDKYYNLNLATAGAERNFVPINALTKAKIDAYFMKATPMEIASSSTVYSYTQGSQLGIGFSSEEYIISLIKKGAIIMYKTYDPRKGHAGIVPDEILDAMAMSNRGGILFGMEADPHRDYIDNVRKAHEATVTYIDCPVVVPDISAERILVSLEPLATNIDEVQIDLPPLHDEKGHHEIRDWEKPYYYVSATDNLWHVYPKHEFTLFKGLKNSLSAWGMKINMIVYSEEEKKALEELAKRDRNGK